MCKSFNTSLISAEQMEGRGGGGGGGGGYSQTTSSMQQYAPYVPKPVRLCVADVSVCTFLLIVQGMRVVIWLLLWFSGRALASLFACSLARDAQVLGLQQRVLIFLPQCGLSEVTNHWALVGSSTV